MLMTDCGEHNLFSMLSLQWDDERHGGDPGQGGQHHGEHHDEGGRAGRDRGEGRAGGGGEAVPGASLQPDAGREAKDRGEHKISREGERDDGATY